MQLNDQFWSEGANFGDLNNDGINDIISGPWWWQGPDFKKRHEYLSGHHHLQAKLGPMTTVDVPGFEGTLGNENKYSDNFFVWTYDFNKDGWNDILVVGFPGTGHLVVRESEGQRGPLDAAQDLRPDRQRVADVHRSDWRRQAGAGLHHQGPVRLRPAGLERSGEAVDVPSRSRRTTSTATSRTAWALAMSTATAGSICWRRTAGGNSRRRSPGDPVWTLHAQPLGRRRRADVRLRCQRRRPERRHHRAAAHGFGLAWYEQYREGRRDQVPRAHLHEQGSAATTRTA